MSELINPLTSTWSLSLLEQLSDSTEVSLINGIPTSNVHWPDSFEWAFTKTGIHTVKSGYSTAQKFPDDASILPFGPDI